MVYFQDARTERPSRDESAASCPWNQPLHLMKKSLGKLDLPSRCLEVKLDRSEADKYFQNKSAAKISSRGQKRTSEYDEEIVEVISDENLEYRAKGADSSRSSKGQKRTAEFNEDTVEVISDENFEYRAKGVDSSRSTKKQCRPTHSNDTPATCAMINKPRRKRKKQPRQKPCRAYKCYECGAAYTSKVSLNSHMATHLGESPYSDVKVHQSPVKYKCNICQNCFQDDIEMSVHNLTHVDDLTESNEKERDKFPCEICQETFPRNSLLQEHYVVSHKGAKPLCCGICGKTFSQTSVFLEHTSQHPIAKPFRCYLCRDAFEKRDNLTYHIKQHSDGKPYLCDFCDKRFYVKENLIIHRETHNPKKVFFCHICNETFSDSQKFVLHSKNAKHFEAVDEQFTRDVVKSRCGICRNYFQDELEVLTHSLTHCDDLATAKKCRQFSCDLCSEQFQKNTALQSHYVLSHRGKKPLCCGLCNRMFTESYDLFMHAAEHSIPRPFRCYICKSGRGTMHSLKSHITKNHKEGKPSVCDICDERFYEWQDLRIHEMAVHITPYVCKVCKEAFTTLRGLTTHRIIHSEYDSVSCNICNAKFRKIYDLNNHHAEVHTSNGDVFTCYDCGKTFVEKKHLKAHVMEHLTNHTATEQPSEPQDVQYQGKLIQIESFKEFKCGICMNRFQDDLEMAVHELIHIDDTKVVKEKRTKPFCCELCPDKFAWNSMLQEHYVISHKGEKPLCCGICNKVYLDKSCFLTHVQGYRITKCFRCYICNAGYEDLQKTRKHIKTHKGGKPFFCFLCEMRFELRNDCTIHMNKHHSSMLRCNLCTKTFTAPERLNTHLIFHVQRGIYKCEICGRGCIVKKDLRRHRLTHGNDRSREHDARGLGAASKTQPVDHIKQHHLKKVLNKTPLKKNKERIDKSLQSRFKCDQCQKFFTSILGLKQHQMTHNGLKPFMCDICGYRGRSKQYMRLHNRVHTGEKPFECVQCKKRFTRAFGLAKHMRMHKGEKPHICHVCGQRFIEKHNLQSHLKRMHKGVSSD